jgi:hypothetical protein
MAKLNQGMDTLYFFYKWTLQLLKFWCINIQIMSTILKKRAFISFIYFKTIIIDISISFGKWRGSFSGYT